MTEYDIKKKLLIQECKRWLGVAEMTHNDGEFIRMFQRAVDHRAVKEPWCMAFVMYCIKMVDETWSVMGNTGSHGLYESEHCLTVWNRSPMPCRKSTAAPGLVVIWQHGNSSAGHTGICLSGPDASGIFQTIEGNTDGDDILNREGDGVYMRARSLNGSGKMKVKGFLDPWGHRDNVVPFVL